jgi:hypothetical protein
MLFPTKTQMAKYLRIRRKSGTPGQRPRASMPTAMERSADFVSARLNRNQVCTSSASRTEPCTWGNALISPHPAPGLDLMQGMVESRRGIAMKGASRPTAGSTSLSLRAPSRAVALSFGLCQVGTGSWLSSDCSGSGSRLGIGARSASCGKRWQRGGANRTYAWLSHPSPLLPIRWRARRLL